MCLVMANNKNLLEYLRVKLRFEFDAGLVNLKFVRNYVSSPRMLDHYARMVPLPGMLVAGDTFLDEFTMLADRRQRTFAISYDDWKKASKDIEVLHEYDQNDSTIINIQVWPFPPAELDNFQRLIAVALSYTRSELDAESRISSSIDDLVSEFGFFTDDF
ncbi:hypothetical protein EGJ55_14195 [Pseudomonas moraviensis]|nr:hypothetical protein EGJ55_14195 [Pseudomonas moraviensis]